MTIKVHAPANLFVVRQRRNASIYINWCWLEMKRRVNSGRYCRLTKAIILYLRNLATDLRKALDIFGLT